MNNIYVDMVGDLFHINHINLIKEAKKFGKHLIVGVHSDSDVESYKCTPILTMEERIGVIESCKYVDKVIPNAPLVITKEYLDENNIDLVVHGFLNKEDEEKQEELFRYVREINKFKTIEYCNEISTSDIIEKIKKEY